MKSVSEFEKRPQSELRVMRPAAGVKGFSRGGDCGRRLDSPACRVLPEHLTGGRAYGFCHGRRANPFAVDPVTRGLNLWGCFATTHCVAPLRKASRFLERQSRVAREQVFIRSVPDGANEIGFDACIDKEFGIHRLVAEAGHRTAVQSQCARRDNQIGALKAAVAKSSGLRD